MGRALATYIALFLVLLHLTNNSYQQMSPSDNAPAPSPAEEIDCGKACNGRCAETKRPNLCKRACGSCCKTCNCVPPGTSGNYDKCPCYFKLKTHNDTRKCP